MTHQRVKSSNIFSVAHDPATQQMEVTFHSGHTYRYQNVTPEQHATFMAADSKGTHFHQNFKQNAAHPFEKVQP